MSLLILRGRPGVLLALILGTFACRESSVPKPQSSTVSAQPDDANADVKNEIIRAVTASQKAGFERHDVNGYLAVWSSDAALVGGRGPSEGPHDLVLNRQQLEATKRLRFTGAAANVVFTPSNTTVEVNGNEAELRWRMTSGNDEFIEVVDERYRLRNTNDGWRVYLNRYWLVAAGPPAATVARDAAFYAAQDKAAAAAKEAGNSEMEFSALAEGGRYVDAFRVLQDSTTEDSDPGAWSRLANFALLVGEVDEAKKAACKARAIAPKPGLPLWAESVTCL